MKHLKFYLPVLFALISVQLLAQDSAWPKSNYVIIGVFRVMENAVQYTKTANKNGFAAQYAISTKTKFYYVYLMSNEDRVKTNIFLSKIRNETIYKDAWIFAGTLGTEEQDVASSEPQTEPKAETKPEPAIEIKVEPIPEPKVEPVAEPKIEPKKSVVTSPAIDSAKTTSAIDSSALAKEIPEVVKKPKGKPFLIKALSKDDGKELTGNIQLQEAIGATHYRLVKSGEITYIEAPANRSGKYKIVNQIPGYKQSALSFDYTDPQREKGSQNEEIITITLEKAGKGDFNDFSNVHFFKNTSILQPKSQTELDELVRIMTDNPKYKIKILGFVNGKNSRETATMGSSTNFFALDKGNKRGRLSSKDLSTARAETVKAYLVQQGIEANRISTKGEGGAVPLYSEDGNQSQLNDRIEVEFIKNR